MPLVTGTPLGNIQSQEDLTLEGAPYLYFQSADADPLNNPDGDNYYWGLSGTSTNPVYNVGCVQDFSLEEDVTMNEVRCDTIGDKDVVQRRNYIEFTFTILSFFPLSVLRHMLKASATTTSAPLEKMGIGTINNALYYMVYAPKVYNEDVGDYLLFHLHRAKFVDAWTISMNSGEPWQLTGLRLRGLIDDTKPAGQEFGVIIRSDASVIT